MAARSARWLPIAVVVFFIVCAVVLVALAIANTVEDAKTSPCVTYSRDYRWFELFWRHMCAALHCLVCALCGCALTYQLLPVSNPNIAHVSCLAYSSLVSVRMCCVVSSFSPSISCLACPHLCFAVLCDVL
jgi:hypothetical protein